MNSLLVACLCAEWCDTCCSYRVEFDALSNEFPQHRFAWIDIENEAETIGQIDVENFPTLLIGQEKTVLFAGVMLPQIGRLRRMLQSMSEDPTPQLGNLAAPELNEYQTLLSRLNQNI